MSWYGAGAGARRAGEPAPAAGTPGPWAAAARGGASPCPPARTRRQDARGQGARGPSMRGPCCLTVLGQPLSGETTLVKITLKHSVNSTTLPFFTFGNGIHAFNQ